MSSDPITASDSWTANPGSQPLLEHTIGEELRRTVARWPDRRAVVDDAAGVSLTWSQVDAESERLARALLGWGVRPGDRVGIWAVNCLEWYLLQWASARVGAVLVTVNPAYRAHEAQFVLHQSGMRLLFASVEHRGSDYRAMVAEVRDDTRLEHAVFVGDASWDEFLQHASRVDHERLLEVERGLRGQDPINIQYTSGTTGFPKGATLSHRNILNNGHAVGEALGYTEHDVVCVPVPFYHCFGMVMGNLAALTHGSAVVIPAPAFDPVTTLEAVERYGCTSLYGVPTMFIAELATDGFAERDLSSLRTGIMAGSPCPVEVMRRVIDDMGMREVAIAYGMTETSPVSTMTLPTDSLDRRTGTVGRTMPHLESRVVDPSTGEVLPRGEAGELCTRGYSVMLGYWDDPERTAEVVDENGWMRTGDLAVMDEDGYLSIVGRIKDMVIRGGENIYPREVEEFLYTHPAIADVQVIGVPDERYGEELMAWIVPRPGVRAPTAEELREFCRGRLAHYKVPRYVHVVDSFPLTVTGKVRKVEMRAMAEDLLGRR